MRIMGLDLGERTIGVAISDSLGWTAQGLEVIRRENPTKDLQRLQELVSLHEIGTIVLGYPKNMNGSIGPKARAAEEFKEYLSGELNLPVILWDERLTTMEAERTLIAADMSRAKRRKVIDKMAAALILQNYLAAHEQPQQKG